MRVLVKGAGVAGLTVAFELAARGATVTVAEMRHGLGGNASWFAGGMLAPWCERESAEQPVLDLGRDAADWWDAVLSGQVTRAGTLVVAAPRDAGELDRFASRTSGHRRVDENEIALLEPDLAGRFRRGLLFPNEAHLDPRQAMAALHDNLATMGVKFHFGCDARPVSGFARQIDCMGMAAADDRLRGVRGEMLILRTPDVSLSRPVRLLHPRFPLYAVPRTDHRFMIGATMIESQSAGPVTARSMMELLGAAHALHPAFGEAEIVETGVGVRPAFPDNLPRVETDGEIIAINGLYRHGFLLAPAMARQAAGLVFSQDRTKEHAHETDGQRRGA
ncbi:MULTISPECIES: glycine oxidase ThiO [unclassified Mesorhizobium]|uniref:glycine oxidase ThiO n=3 Tax=Mesorhizobium TaxID=68287 RepID=UPI000F753867|nr:MULTISPECIES: glycine oxidase ThiO [unclassified Mesorhizobium]RUY13275.1 glycine oxidase ThiO [Mesorhizobium sp. M2A.F.Ca.ET.040.01.1.1]RVC80337.1 glycine oxidase ThiO [Mesorhizobium sp. M2A.F.Ca.ET.046.02.1.1]TGQ75004.1 glycine oxidase ThiO [bacterium M00.F.Ca.ET.205.01.1.1]TGS95567.1 glycine oxidase ThiO [bacterium M00.F.Ca.ET.177.01.1.1]TGT57025.1 glycine oxidase ThiO [Mesorhizobium sp. M00.F.Ca.ET.170.01.1.1]TGT79202.1 glycine oxidase ThiO [bacterium M00.F.Ca.ET.157.01.1.1]TGU54966.1